MARLTWVHEALQGLGSEWVRACGGISQRWHLVWFVHHHQQGEARRQTQAQCYRDSRCGRVCVASRYGHWLSPPSVRPLPAASQETLVTVAWHSKVKFMRHSGVVVQCEKRVVECPGSTIVQIYVGVSQDLLVSNRIAVLRRNLTCANTRKTCTVFISGDDVSATRRCVCDGA